jgi:hypothetical protein
LPSIPWPVVKWTDTGEDTCVKLCDTHTTPGFEQAFHNACLIEAVRRADEQGERQQIESRDESMAMVGW